MQTFPSHALLGIATGQVAITLGLVPEYPLWFVWLISFSGAIAPDMVMMPQFLYDKACGRQPMTDEARLTFILKELSHSLPLWCGLVLVVSLVVQNPLLRDALLLFVASGILGGIFPDIPTHSEERFKNTDCTFLYPFGDAFKKVIGTDTLRWQSETWEYRFGHGVLWPLKQWELNCNIVVAVIIVLLLFIV